MRNEARQQTGPGSGEQRLSDNASPMSDRQQQRQKRLEQQLRDNLKKRKALTKARAGANSTAASGPEPSTNGSTED